MPQLLSMTAEVPRYGPPGAPFSYDNFGYCVLGAVIEAVTRRPFDEAVTALVLEPLRLNDTVFHADDAIGRRMAAGHTLTARRPGSHRRRNGTMGGSMADPTGVVAHRRGCQHAGRLDALGAVPPRRNDRRDRSDLGCDTQR